MHFSSLVWLTAALVSVHRAAAQEEWPKTITTNSGAVIDLYQPQVENFAGNTLRSRSAFSVKENGVAEPVFGVFWATSTVEVDRDTRQVTVESVRVNNIKAPADSTLIERDHIRQSLESFIPKAAGVLPLDEVLSSLDEQRQEAQLSKNLNNTLPKLYFRTRSSMLVLTDGQPILKRDKRWRVDLVTNSPFIIIRPKDGKFYLFGGGHWYVAPAATGPYVYNNDKVKHKLKRMARSLKKAAVRNDDLPTDETSDKPVYDIIVSATPAELIQTEGSPDLAPISGTSLLYVKNSDNDLFVDTRDQHYYLLLSGRWYTSASLNENSSWQFIESDRLPADFSRIPEGSPKDGVLASVAGTQAAKEAVMDAQIPQTAKVDRRSAVTQVVYDGTPQFKPIAGTDLQYAINTSSTVLEEHGRYFSVDNGVWFTAESPMGPWAVSSDRPEEMDQVPPDYPVYNAKYVYVYDSGPDYVYDGYTPGYLNSFVDGPTVVYGTGYAYDPWVGADYYPRPWTWGFGMCYNPWSGWGFGAGYDYDWFDDGFGWGTGWDGGLGFGWGGWDGGGWWGGASAYRPCYRNWHGGRFRSDTRGGYYGRDAVINPGTHMHMRYNNNVYRSRQGIVRPSRPGGFDAGREPVYGRPGTTVFTDREGNIYRPGAQGEWQQRVNRGWTAPVNRSYTGGMSQQRQMISRGQVRTMNFQRASQFGGMRFGGGSFGGARPSGGGSFGGARPSGGGARFGGGHFGGRR